MSESNPPALGAPAPSELGTLAHSAIPFPVQNLVSRNSQESGPRKPRASIGSLDQDSDVYKLWTLEELDNYPEPEWLIDGLFMVDSQSLLIGAPGEYKSFVALSFALSIASGRPWMGRAVKQGPVVYIAAEGGRGIRKRIRAWEREHSVEGVEKSLRVILDDPQLHTHANVRKALATVRSLPKAPIFIVVDTLARTFVGGDENAAQEMGEWVKGAHQLQKLDGAAVMTLHHPIKRGGRNGAITERGSTALRGAVDTIMAVKKRDRSLTLSCQKQKDEEEFDAISLQVKVVDVTVNPHKPQNSLVVVDGEASAVAETANLLSSGAQTALKALMTLPEPDVSKTEWHLVVNETSSQKVPERTFMNWVSELIAANKVERKNRGTYRLREPRTATAIELPITAIQQAA